MSTYQWWISRKKITFIFLKNIFSMKGGGRDGGNITLIVLLFIDQSCWLPLHPAIGLVPVYTKLDVATMTLLPKHSDN